MSQASRARHLPCPVFCGRSLLATERTSALSRRGRIAVMEPERTTTEVTPAIGEGPANAPDPFGIRPPTGRPHSINLFGRTPPPARSGAARSVDLLLGMGIGAAAMYYLDPDRGP